MKTILIIAAVVILAALVAFAIFKKKGVIDKVAQRIKGVNVDVSSVDGELHFQDCVAWFKAFNLDPKKDTPFIMDYAKNKDLLAGGVLNNPVTKPCAVFLGVYDEKADILAHAHVIQADKLDDETAKNLASSEDGLVVLS